MKSVLVGLIVGILLVAASVYYAFFYPPNMLENRTNEALHQFTEAVASKDHTAISAALQTFIAEDAVIRLHVSFFAPVQVGARPLVSQDFTKADFIRFIDNTLYPLADYHYAPALEQFALSEDRTSADVTFSGAGWGDGASFFGGMSVEMRHQAESKCVGQVRFTPDGVQLANTNCEVTLRAAPKPGQEQKLKESSDALREYLQR